MSTPHPLLSALHQPKLSVSPILAWSAETVGLSNSAIGAPCLKSLVTVKEAIGKLYHGAQLESQMALPNKLTTQDAS